ncbi:hypothetical protein BJX70DRAFT_123405 [Aspergillus crustosus]
MLCILNANRWVEAGSPHDAICFICFKPRELEGCDTCRRSYHTSCMPPSSSRGLGEGPQSQAWYCDVCVDRGWHENPPMMTPPDSPVFGGVEKSRQALDEESRAGDSESSLGQRQASVQPSAPALGPQLPQLPVQTAPKVHQPASTANEGVRRGLKISAASAAPVPFASRKSRYNTLSDNVESALTTLYQELEKIPFLEQKVDDLESEVSRLNQEVRIQRNELALSRRMNVSTGELQKLKSEAADRQAAVDAASRLEAKNQELETHITDLREMFTTSDRNLQDLKKKLSTLIGE